MSKKFILSIVLFCLGIVAKAAATDISACENIVYAKSTTAMAGTTIKLPILMNNTTSVPGFQFDMVLPEGVSFVKAELSLDRTTAANTNTFEYQEQADGAIRVLVASTSNATFTGNAGEVATVTLSINENVADGSYPIILKGIVISDLNAQGVQSLEEVESTLTVGKPEYSTDFGIQIAPFELSSDVEDVTAGVSFVINKGTYKTVEYDIIFPEGWKENDLMETVNVRGNSYEGDSFSHLSVKKTSGADFSTTSNIISYKLYSSSADASYILSAGIYPIQITNIVATDADGNKYYAAPTTTYVKVGEPTEGEIALEGHVTEDVATAISNETSLTKIDMSKVVSIDGSLALRDGCDFVAPRYDVAVGEAKFNRTMTNKIGTICLPFDIASNASIQFYQLKSVGDSKMTFESIASVQAGTPALFQLLNEQTEVAITTNAAMLKAGNLNWSGDLAQWTMKGTYSTLNLDPADNANTIYYINGNKFYKGNQTFKVSAYRGWFEASAQSEGAKNASYSIGFGDGETTGIDIIEKENGEIDLIFDLGGKQLPQSKKGINIINNKKVLVK